MHKPWLYLITGISGYQVVAQRVERHGRSREIRNAHVLARCGTLNVSRGKGEAALKEFACRLRKQKVIDRIGCVCMDMSNAYYAWVGHNLREDTLIVFDHFHVIMKMNEHINCHLRKSHPTNAVPDLAAIPIYATVECHAPELFQAL